ncbi:hypothetical protein QAD02_001708 [Eretmocerus hayati]|uniref:Uncharacterized protein n=1 Tax=Eretmocerus hayati TaxID=131215 RepID=A0ACC2NGS4_9HYME|nr:hypothetical protein QAD02_001708 [Eretmocerus hayati]
MSTIHLYMFQISLKKLRVAWIQRATFMSGSQRSKPTLSCEHALYVDRRVDAGSRCTKWAKEPEIPIIVTAEALVVLFTINILTTVMRIHRNKSTLDPCNPQLFQRYLEHVKMNCTHFDVKVVCLRD